MLPTNPLNKSRIKSLLSAYTWYNKKEIYNLFNYRCTKFKVTPLAKDVNDVSEPKSVKASGFFDVKY